MEDIEILSQMIKGAARVQLSVEYNKPRVILTEPREPDSTVIINNMPFDALIIKVDAFKSPDDIFNGNKGECKRADYVIISYEKKRIIYIEMKKSKDSWRQIVCQLRGARCFVVYCQEIGKAFWQEKDFLQNYKHRFVSISHTSIPKRKTRIERKSGKHDSPEKAMKVSWPNHLQFNHLAGT